jgi:hypothetical protein
VPVVETVGWRVMHVIFTHLAYARVFAVRIAIELAFETVVLNLGSCFAEVLVDLFMTNRMVDFNTGLTGTWTRNVMLKAAKLSVLLWTQDWLGTGA